jgi:DNA-binding Lrp family transcriptional regulator
MATDLHAGRRQADAVGVVDDARRQPQDPALDRLEHCDVDGRRGSHGDHRPTVADLLALRSFRDGSLRLEGSKGYDRAVPRAHLDDLDEKIIELLVQDARRSASDVGRRVGLSPAAAKRRIDRLEAAGVITGYKAVLDHAKLGSRIEAFTELRFAGATQVDEIAKTYADLAELVEAYTIAGDPDALVRLRVTDLDHLKRVIDRIRRSGKVTGTKTLIVLGTTPGA